MRLMSSFSGWPAYRGQIHARQDWASRQTTQLLLQAISDGPGLTWDEWVSWIELIL